VKKSRFTDEQIVFALKQAETGNQDWRFAARWALAMLLFTSGDKSTVAWGLQSSGNLSSWRRRAAKSSASLLT